GGTSHIPIAEREPPGASCFSPGWKPCRYRSARTRPSLQPGEIAGQRLPADTRPRGCPFHGPHLVLHVLRRRAIVEMCAGGGAGCEYTGVEHSAYHQCSSGFPAQRDQFGLGGSVEERVAAGEKDAVKRSAAQ